MSEKYDYIIEKENLKTNNTFLVISIFMFFVVFYLFVYFFDTMIILDIVLVSSILLFFLYQVFRQSNISRKRKKEMKKLKRLYDISLETEEEKFYRERVEKMTRVMKKKKGKMFGIKDFLRIFVKIKTVKSVNSHSTS